MEKLPEEMLIRCMVYLRAMDLATLREVNKALFPVERISQVIHEIIDNGRLLEKGNKKGLSTTATQRLVYPAHGLYLLQHASSSSSSPLKKHHLSVLLDPNSLLSPAWLHVFEVSCILAALSFPAPLASYCSGQTQQQILSSSPHQSSYWISTSWVSNAKKFFEAMDLPDLVQPTTSGQAGTPNKKGKPLNKQQMIRQRQRQRRGSECLPPWPVINRELLCRHGQIGLIPAAAAGTTGSGGVSSPGIVAAEKGKRNSKKIISGWAWCLLRSYYPMGPQARLETGGGNGVGTEGGSYGPLGVCCAICQTEVNTERDRLFRQREQEMKDRRDRFLPPCLLNLVTSRGRQQTGFPSFMMMRKDSPSSSAVILQLLENEEERQEAWLLQALHDHDSDGGGYPSSTIVPSSYPTLTASYSPCPLLPGFTYHLVPRTWLRSYRRFVNYKAITLDSVASSSSSISSTASPSSPVPPSQPPPPPPMPLDLSCMLCPAHGLLCLPSSLMAFLVGSRRSPLRGGRIAGPHHGQGLVEEIGEEVEIVTVEEWTALQTVAASLNRSHLDSSYSTGNGGRRATTGRGGGGDSDPFLGVSCRISKEDSDSDDNSSKIIWSIDRCSVCDPSSSSYSSSSSSGMIGDLSAAAWMDLLSAAGVVASTTSTTATTTSSSSSTASANAS